jgi:malonyl-CoA O-methyltransferase
LSSSTPNQSNELSIDQVQRQFDRAAESYDSVASVQRRMGEQIVAAINEVDVSKEQPLVDLGCGTGTLLEKVSKLGFSDLTGVDLSPQMLAHTIEKVEQIELIEADIESLPFENDSFSTVISNAAIQWCSTTTAATEMHRILQPTGRLFASTFVAGTLAQWQTAFEINGLPSRVHSLETAQQIEAAFTQAGFADLKIDTYTIVSEFDAVDSMFQSIKKLGATNAMESRPRGMMRRSEYQTLVGHFQQQLKKEGVLKLDFCYVIVTAQKQR